ncbi:MAG: helix-turn-helix domain-containing protein [Opitutaceae bacterium]|jgi:DNA invertase Pin-like site-specific DNA recombinase
MAGINIDLSRTSASAVLTTLRIRRGELERELAEVVKGIGQLETITLGQPSEPKMDDRGNYTVAEKAIRKQLIQTLPWGATAAEIVDETGVSRATVYRLLNAMKDDGEVLQSEDGHWILVSGYIPKPK